MILVQFAHEKTCISFKMTESLKIIHKYVEWWICQIYQFTGKHYLFIKFKDILLKWIALMNFDDFQDVLAKQFVLLFLYLFYSSFFMNHFTLAAKI